MNDLRQSQSEKLDVQPNGPVRKSPAYGWSVLILLLGFVLGMGVHFAIQYQRDPGPDYLPPEFRKRADVSVGELNAWKWSYFLAESQGPIFHAPEAQFQVRRALVELLPDKILIRAAFDSPEQVKWEHSPRDVRTAGYQQLCASLVASTSDGLKVDPKLVVVEWCVMNRLPDSGSYRNGKLEVTEIRGLDTRQRLQEGP